MKQWQDFLLIVILAVGSALALRVFVQFLVRVL